MSKKQRIRVPISNSLQFALDVNAKPLSREIATRQNSIDYVNLLGYLPNPDPVLKKLGRDIAAYEETMSEASVSGMVFSRKSGVAGLNYGIDRGKAASRQTRLIEDWLTGVKLDQVIREILDAEQFGYAILETVFEPVGGYWLPTKIAGKPQRWFKFSQNNELLFLSKSNPVYGELVPDRQFIVATHNATYANPYGFPLQSCCFWPVVFKRGGLKFLAVFCEKYGMPYIIGKQPRGIPDGETDDLLDALENMVQDAIAVIPDDASVEIMEAGNKSGSADAYKALLTYCDTQISIAQLGHSGGALATPNSLGGVDAAALSVRADIVQAGKSIVESAINTIISWIWAYNFTGPAPRFDMWPDEDIDKPLAERDEILTRQGVRFTKDYYTKAYSLEDGDFDIVPQSAGAPQAAMFAAPANNSVDTGMQQIDAMGRRMQDDPANDTLIDTIRSALDASSDLVTFRDKLIELFPKMDTAQLSRTMAMAFTSAELAGRFEINRRLGL